MRLSQYKPERNPMISPWRIIAVNEAPLADETDAAEIAEHIDHGRFSSNSLGDHLVFGSLRTAKTRIERRRAALTWERRRNLARERVAMFDFPRLKEARLEAEHRRFAKFYERQDEIAYRRNFVIKWRNSSKDHQLRVHFHLSQLATRLNEFNPEVIEHKKRDAEIDAAIERDRQARVERYDASRRVMHERALVSFNPEDVANAEHLFKLSEDWPMRSGIYFAENQWYVQINDGLRLRIKGPYEKIGQAQFVLLAAGAA